VSEEPFGSRLRRERERRRIALSSISANTKISVALFEALERDDVSRWPSGIFRRAFIRSYADAIGLDADVLTREFLERFPDPTEPAPAAVADAPRPASGDPVLRLTLADDGAPFRGGRLLGKMRQRLAAVVCDAGVVLAIAASVFLVSGRFWLPLGVSMLLYYLGGILLLGNTPGVCLWAPVPGRGAPPSISPTRLWTMVRSALALLDRFTHSASSPDAQGTPRSDSSNSSARESSGSSVRQLGTSSR
jgi:transcriptional regulator with XRE-family HTH domain